MTSINTIRHQLWQWVTLQITDLAGALAHHAGHIDGHALDAGARPGKPARRAPRPIRSRVKRDAHVQDTSPSGDMSIAGFKS